MAKVKLTNENPVVKSIIVLLRVAARAHRRTDAGKVFYIKIMQFY